jgi:uncharacterized protein (UPF0264 family)
LFVIFCFFFANFALLRLCAQLLHALLQFQFRSTGLLVSVRNADEARVALASGADVIDVKEPNRGSLGAADAEVVAAVAAAVGERAPISVAVGELLEGRCLATGTAGITYAKLGLAGCRSRDSWPARWRASIQQWPAGVRPVAVVYADWDLADSPLPEDVLAEAVTVGCPALLIDTWDKSRGTLFEHWPPHDVAQFCSRVRAAGITVVLAGSLHGESLQTAVSYRPDLIAVRGAVCEGRRTGTISAARVRTVLAALRTERAVASEGLLSPQAATEMLGHRNR